MATKLLDSEALAHHLKMLHGERELNLAFMSLSEMVPVIARYITHQTGFLKVLDLRGNGIKDDAAVILFRAIEQNRSLETLLLKWNVIGSKEYAIRAACGVLRSHKTIRHVDLRNNGISRSAAKHLSDMLAENRSITALDLSWNELGEDGGSELLDGLVQNTTILDLRLVGTRVGDAELKQSAFVCEKNLGRREAEERRFDVQVRDKKIELFGETLHLPGRGLEVHPMVRAFTNGHLVAVSSPTSVDMRMSKLAAPSSPSSPASTASPASLDPVGTGLNVLQSRRRGYPVQMH